MSSDIEADHFIFRKTPERLHPYIKLARLDRPIGIWLLLLPCLWAVALSSEGIMNATSEAWLLMVKLAIGATLMRAAGCVINDLQDRQLDASVERTKDRPLASGEISVPHAMRFLGGLLAASLLILLTMPRLAIIFGVISLLPVAVYPKMKKITWWPQLFLGFTFNWGALLGWAAATGHFSWTSIFLYVGGIFWTLGYDTIYACQDKEDDATVGIKSTARLLGKKSYAVVSAFYGLSLLLLMFAKYHTQPTILTPLLASFALIHLIWQIQVWDMNNPASCLRVFKSNYVYGLLILLMLAI